MPRGHSYIRVRLSFLRIVSALAARSEKKKKGNKDRHFQSQQNLIRRIRNAPSKHNVLLYMPIRAPAVVVVVFPSARARPLCHGRERSPSAMSF